MFIFLWLGSIRSVSKHCTKFFYWGVRDVGSSLDDDGSVFLYERISQLNSWEGTCYLGMIEDPCEAQRLSNSDEKEAVEHSLGKTPHLSCCMVGSTHLINSLVHHVPTCHLLLPFSDTKW